MHPRNFPLQWLTPVQTPDPNIRIEPISRLLTDWSIEAIREATRPKVTPDGTAVILYRGVYAEQPSYVPDFVLDRAKAKPSWRRTRRRSLMEVPEKMREMAYKQQSHFHTFWTDAGYISTDRSVLITAYYGSGAEEGRIIPFIYQAGAWRQVNLGNRTVKEQVRTLTDLLSLAL